MTVSDSTHECPKRGCRERVRWDQLACKRHWYGLPLPIRQAVLKAFRRGLGVGTPEHNAAVNTAIRVMNARGNGA